MFYSVNNKIIEVGGKIPERKVNSLTLTIDDSGFPISNATGEGRFGVASLKPISLSIVIDGSVFNFSSSYQINGMYYLSITSNGQPINGFNTGATSGNYGLINFSGSTGSQKTITIFFENMQSITELLISQFNVYGSLPSEINFMSSLNSLTLTVLREVTNFPEDLSNLKKLKKIELRLLGDILEQIPDSFFDLDLEDFKATAVFNLSDEITSNLFKVNQWKNLERLFLESSEIKDYFSEEWLVFKDSLVNLRLTQNNFTQFPVSLKEFESLINLYFTINNDSVVDWFQTEKLVNLSTLLITGNARFDNLENDWLGFKALKNISQFHNWIDTNAKFDQYIDSFYTLVIENAFLNTSSTESISTGFPNQFRDISWGHSSLTPTGIIQSPSGFVQGLSNGSPASQGEKIYVLVNNYGHTVTTS